MTASDGAGDISAGPPAGPVRGDVVPFRRALWAWFVISWQTFGGPAGQIAVMQRALVDEKRWIGQRRFLHALNFCHLLPGPEAQQLAIYTGWLLNGTRGGIAAGTLFVIPGVLTMFVLSAIYVRFGVTTAVAAVFAGLAPAVLAIVAQAVWRVASRALGGPALMALAVAAFVGLTVFGLPFPVVVVAAAACGALLGRYAPATLHRRAAAEPVDEGPAPLIPDDVLHAEAPSRRRAVTVLVIGVLAWMTPVLAAVALSGPGSILVTQGVFFSGTALITFGGAYAVLAYVAQRAVEVFHWLAPGEMVRGLALAETTPGPLIMVVQFVAFVGAYRHPGDLTPWLAATLASLITVWATFVPCFVFVFIGAPYLEKLRSNEQLSAALAGITAAVVGVIANLGVYFAIHTLFGTSAYLNWGPVHLLWPQPDTWRPVAAAIAAVAVVVVFALKWSIPRTLAVCTALGVAAALAHLPIT